MKRLFLLSLIFLVSCADPQIVYKPVKVEVPVYVPCKPRPIIKPTLATATVTAKSSFVRQVRALVVAEKQRDAYEVQLEGAVNSCQ